LAGNRLRVKKGSRITASRTVAVTMRLAKMLESSMFQLVFHKLSNWIAMYGPIKGYRAKKFVSMYSL
jgi:hypothetical protein